MLSQISRSVVRTVPKTMTRNCAVVPGPALNPMSTAQTVAYGVGMFAFWMSYPMYVLSNIKHFKKGKGE